MQIQENIVKGFAKHSQAFTAPLSFLKIELNRLVSESLGSPSRLPLAERPTRVGEMLVDRVWVDRVGGRLLAAQAGAASQQSPGRR